MPRNRTVHLFAQSTRIAAVTSSYSVPAGIAPVVRRFGPLLLRLGAGVTVLWFLGRELGVAPFEDGLRAVTWPGVAAAVTLTALTTLCSAWRWRLVARALGTDISLSRATGAYYRSLFLNVTLPGGIVGDVHRGLSHGHDTQKVGRALRAVAWERFAGQVVQIILTAVILLALPSPVHAAMPLVALALAVAAVVLLLVARLRTGGRSAWGRVRDTVVADVRGALLARGGRLGIALASALIVAGHALTFLIAARAAGTTAPLSRMLPIALLAMMAMTLPNVAGWGPREGVTAWAFGAAGLGAGAGVTTSIVYGVMAIVAALPGAAVLLIVWFRSTRLPARKRLPIEEGAAHA